MAFNAGRRSLKVSGPRLLNASARQWPRTNPLKSLESSLHLGRGPKSGLQTPHTMTRLNLPVVFERRMRQTEPVPGEYLFWLTLDGMCAHSTPLL